MFKTWTHHNSLLSFHKTLMLLSRYCYSLLSCHTLLLLALPLPCYRYCYANAIPTCYHHPLPWNYATRHGTLCATHYMKCHILHHKHHFSINYKPLYPGVTNQMNTFHENFLLTSAQTGREDVRTPQHKTHHDHFEKRQFSSSGKPHHPSRSWSPSCCSTYNCHSSPPPYSCLSSASSSPSKQPSFQQGAGSKSPRVCALCLGQEACDLLKCQSNTLWDGSKARCRKNDQGWLVSPTGLVLCFDWNIWQGCTAQGHKDQHECSGCRNNSEVPSSSEKNRALTPYNTNTWNLLLWECNLLKKYPNIPNSLAQGFDTGIWRIYETATPSNGPTLMEQPEAYQKIVEKEFERGCYIGPCSHNEVEALIRPFQSSPLSLVPKPGKPGQFHAVHNFSYPHIPSICISSINYTIDSNMYPCTWSTFSTMCYTIYNLPPGLQASIHNVAEAYRTIPITHSQWLGLVIKLQEDDSFAINTCNNFGLSSAGGIYGELGDARVDIFCARGIGPLSKWVNDHIFFCIWCEFLSSYNDQPAEWCKVIAKNSGQIQSGSWYWYWGKLFHMLFNW